MNSIPESFEALYIFLILLPGFLTLMIERTLSYQIADSHVFTLTKSLVYSFVNYSVFLMTQETLVYWTIIENSDEPKQLILNSNPRGFAILLFVSILLGSLIGLFKNKDWHMKFARFIHLTKRTSRDSIWLDLFHDKFQVKKKTKELKEKTGAYVTVILKDGRNIFGWPEYFADSFNDGPVLFVTDAKWISEDKRG